MSKTPLKIGPVKDLKTLVEVLALVRSIGGGEVLLDSTLARWKELLSANPWITKVVVSSHARPDINLLKTTPLEVIEKRGVPYIYPWMYLSTEERIKAHRDETTKARPKLLILTDEVPNSLCKEMSLWLHEIIPTEPELLCLKDAPEPRQTVSRIIAADLVVSTASEAALVSAATGTPVVVVTNRDTSTKDLFRAFFPDKNIVVIDEYGPEIHLCPGDRDSFLSKIQDVLPDNRAVFFDRDGTLCEDVNYLSRFEDLKIFPDTGRLRDLKTLGYMLIGITNQSGIARGIIPPEVNERVNRVFCSEYGFDDFYYCPHHPDEHCACRKPSPGMLLKARRDHRIVLSESIVVGDRDSDMLLALAVGAKGIHITTGQQKHSSTAHKSINSLEELVDLISSF